MIIECWEMALLFQRENQIVVISFWEMGKLHVAFVT